MNTDAHPPHAAPPRPTPAIIIIAAAAAMGAAVTACAPRATRAGDNLGPAVSANNAERIEAHGIALEIIPELDRYTFFGPEAGPNLLYTANLAEPAPADGAYLFRGGCYTWVAPQNAWIDQDAQPANWPPDPAMDIGPAQRIARSLNAITTITPNSRLNLRERKTFTLTPTGGTLEYQLINTANSTIQLGAWINTAAGPNDRIAIYMPPGTELRGWDDTAIEKIQSVLAPPSDDSPWRIIDLRAANWPGGTKVWFYPPDATPAIAIHRHGRWLIRTMDQRDTTGTLRAAGEGPIAVYIDRDAKIIEAELYAPIETIPPGESATASETWTILPPDLSRVSPTVLPDPPPATLP